jgi:DNA-binding FrmR family transcriptional regulator
MQRGIHQVRADVVLDHLRHQAGHGAARPGKQMHDLLAGARGAMAGLMAQVVEDHVRTHLVDADRHPDALNTEAAEQLLDVVRTYLK